MHDPIGLVAVRGASGVENEGFPHSYSPGAADMDGLVPPRGLPETGRGGPVRARPSRVLLVLVAEEVPVVLGA